MKLIIANAFIKWTEKNITQPEIVVGERSDTPVFIGCYFEEVIVRSLIKGGRLGGGYGTAFQNCVFKNCKFTEPSRMELGSGNVISGYI